MSETKKVSFFTGLIKFIKSPLEATLCILLVAIVLVTFIQVLFRYLFHFSLAWSEELARFFFLWLAALSSAYAFKTKSHFVLRLLVDRFGRRLQNWVSNLVVLLVTLFLLVFIWKSIEYTLSMANQIAPSTRMSMAFPYSSVIVGGILMLYFVLRNWWSEKQNPGKDHVAIK